MRIFSFLVPLVLLIVAGLFTVKPVQALEELTVHLIPHTHDDVGWLKTVDQYFTGTKNWIQTARVQYIIDSAVAALERSPDRKFIYVEMAFLWRWFSQQTDERKDVVRRLVKNGQLEFINAGWSMNDEAATYYQSVIDNMALGHAFLLKEFDFVPTIGWHIDPFGHSATQASLFATMGFDGFFFWRIDYQDRELRHKQRRMETMWQGSASLGTGNSIFTSIMDGYGPPEGFCWDINCWNADDPIQPRKDLVDYDLDVRAEKFAAAARQQAKYYPGNDILQTYGSDFQLEDAELYYSNLDILIKYFNEPSNFAKYKLRLKYSTPSIYAKTKFDSNLTLEVKTDDFFPYADNPHAYWTGYFVSRAAYKAYERYSNGYLQTCKHLDFVRSLSPISGNLSDATPFTLEESMGIAQHHDSVTGTAKQHVNDDYTKRLATGCSKCDTVASEGIRILLEDKSTETLIRCEYLNVSICDPTESLKESLDVVVYNSLAHSRIESVRVPVSHDGFNVYNEQGIVIPSQVIPLTSDIARARLNVFSPSKAAFELVFDVHMKALSVTKYVIKSIQSKQPSTWKYTSDAINDVVLENPFLKVTFNSSTGGISGIYNKLSQKSVNIAQSWEWYESSTGTSDDSQASGAYIFRPVNNTPNKFGAKATISVVRGDIVDEVYQTFSTGGAINYISQKFRLYHSQPHLEMEYTLGPIDVTDEVGKEVITKFTTSLDSGDVFHTDANGREILKRVRNHRETWPLDVHEPVSGNYYPVNTRIMIRDENQDSQLTIITDRSQGGSSLSSGELEVMINRRTTRDDSRGVDEPLNEDIVLRGRYWIVFDTIESSNEYHRLNAERLQHPVWPFFGKVDSSKSVNQLAKYELPQNIHLVTLQNAEQEGHGILRLAHLFACDESKKFSIPQTVDVAAVFGLQIVDELSLTANQKLKNMHRLPFSNIASVPSSSIVEGSVVSISPMEIRTYLVKPLSNTA